ncbi:NAD(P)-dependent oxidoreductase [Gordonia rhizosphera]|uniref:Putative oxidoreductase n=1 Tax=Gordonia rhizosphera NBRC 16068 TaxID=1108045 RepID=K6WSX3_9ACTN|nr:NAD(P)-dependent oxidoreductase [Gordonia rhizosphera]GAB89659.1 putative oxidoreductase [Gordonia rhizosphera NBRC 16068]
MSEVAVIGVGRMGMPMVSRLVAAGHAVSALGRTPEVRKALSASGARACAKLADVTTTGTEIVVVAVLTDEQVREVCLAGPLMEQLPSGATIVIHTTGSPRTALEIAEEAARRDLAVVDAAVSGGPHDIAAGHLTVFAGGDESVVDSLRPILGAYAEPILYVGATGSGQVVKLVNNAMFAAQIGLARAGVELAARLGVDERLLLSALPNGSSNSRALESISRYGSVDGFTERVREFVGKDVDVVRKVTAELGTDLGLLDDLISQIGI